MTLTDVKLTCQCGTVTGTAKVSPDIGNRGLCYCNSCRKFSEQIDEGKALDEWGGTEIYQMPIGYLSFQSGQDQIKCLHLSEGGLNRWYASCCNSLIGNTGSPKLPFIGLIHTFIDQDVDRDTLIGPMGFYGFTQDAKVPLPDGRKSGAMFGFIVKFMSQLLWWKLSGKAKPNPLFDEHNNPIAEPIVLTQ